jgi:hypothetical protein
MAHMDETERIARLEQVVIPQAHHEILGRCAESHLESFVPSGVQRAAHLMREAISGHQIASREFRSKWGAASGAPDEGGNQWSSDRISRVSFHVGCSERRTVLVCRRCPEQSSSTKVSLVRPAQIREVHQWPSEVIRGHQRPSEVIRGHQRSSEVIRGHQGSSEVIRGHQMHRVAQGRLL